MPEQDATMLARRIANELNIPFESLRTRARRAAVADAESAIEADRQGEHELEAQCLDDLKCFLQREAQAAAIAHMVQKSK